MQTNEKENDTMCIGYRHGEALGKGVEANGFGIIKRN